jgi:hypothetical protein
MNTSQWRASPAHVESEQKPRLLSQQSTGAHDQEANHASSYDQSRSSRLYGAVSQGPNILSSGSDVTGRSSPVDSGLYTPHQLELQAFDGYPFSGMEELSGQTTFHGDSVSGLPHSSVSMTAGQPYSLFATADDTYASLPNGPSDLSSQMSQASLNLNSAIGCNSPAQLLWNDNIVSGSQRSSPALLEDWVPPYPQMTTSATNSPLDYSPSLEGLSPRYVQDFPDLVDLDPYAIGDRVMRKPVGPRQSKVVSDLQRQRGTSEASDESFRMVGRSSLDVDNTARDHPLYQNVTPQADGLYHCPWEGQENCPHKPEKLKCNYEYDPFSILPFPLQC